MYIELINKTKTKNALAIISFNKDILANFFIGFVKAFDFSNKEKKENEKKDEYNGIAFLYFPNEKKRIISISFSNLKLNETNTKNMIISYSFDKEKPTQDLFSKQWILDKDNNQGIILKDIEFSNFFKKLLIHKVLKVKAINNNLKINEKIDIRLKSFKDLYETYEDNFN